jgi:hypothetical protein
VSSNVASQSGQAPRLHVAPPADRTFGDLAADLAASYGLAPDPWQRLVLDDWLAQKGDRWSSLTCGLAVPRQNGKNALLEVRELFGLVGLGERILHTAHEVKTAQKHFRRLKHFFGSKADDPAAQYPELNALVTSVRSVNGQEAIFLRNGASIEIVARSKNSGRGFTVDVLVMDEAQEMSEDALEALMPTTSAAPLGNPQWIFTGTPPGPHAEGEVFTRVRREATGPKPGATCWHEWSIPGPLSKSNLDDRASWAAVNPALGSRLQLDVIAGERARFSDDGFARERLGLWSDDSGYALVTPGRWAELEVEAAPDGIRSYAVAFSFDDTRVSLGGAVRPAEGPVHVELIDSVSNRRDGGVVELADWFCEGPPGEERWRRAAQIALCGRAGASVLHAALRERGVPEKVLWLVTSPQYMTACSMFLDAVRDGSMSHLAGQEPLDRSVTTAEKKTRGQDGAWGWQAPEGGDETPTEAVTVALWAARTSKRRPGRKAVMSY